MRVQAQVHKDSLVSYLSLTKPRIMLLVNLVGLASLIAALGPGSSIQTIAYLLVAGSLASGGASALNSYLDRDIDALMGRTSLRPIPSGRIKPPYKAVYFGTLLSALGLSLSYMALNPLATTFIALGIIIYIVVYTSWLKRRHSMNIVLGGSAGSMAALAGWAAAKGDVGLPAVMIALLVFLWTPSHFWSLAFRIREEYSKARIPMLPALVDEKRSAIYIAINTLVLVAFLPIPYLLGLFGPLYLITAMAGGLALLHTNLRLVKSPSKGMAWSAFKLSSPYLAIVLIAIMVEAMLGL